MSVPGKNKIAKTKPYSITKPQPIVSESKVNWTTAKSNRTIHETYISFILISIIIFLVTYRFGDSKKLTDYISFALTISSILLALVAIGMTLVGNSNLDRHFANLTRANADMIQNSQTITNVSNALTEQLSQLSEYVEGVGKSIESSHERVGRKLDELHERTISSGIDRISNIDSPPPPSEIDFLKFWDICSWSGRLYIYAAARMSGADKALSRLEYLKSVETVNADYLHGFEVACVASGILTAHNSDSIKIHIASVNAEKMKQLMLREIAEYLPSESGDDEVNMPDFYRESLSSVDTYVDLELSK